MNHVDLDACDEAVKRFFLTLAPDPRGSVLELGGRPVARVLPVTTATGTDDWDSTKDARRCELIDRDITGALTSAEGVELRELQAAMLRHRRRVAPLPLDEARQLFRDLLTKAADGPAT